jgi:hypothetical protein
LERHPIPATLDNTGRITDKKVRQPSLPMTSRVCPVSHPTRVACLMLLVMACSPAAAARTPALEAAQLKLIEVNEPDGQILSYRHLAGSTEVYMRGTRRAPDARIKLKVGSRPGFVELDINRGGISGLEPANRLGKDFLTYVLWAVSVDGKASNLGEITFQRGHPVAVNLTTPYQTFWLMVTAEPNYAVVDPSQEVVLYSVKQGAVNDRRAITINRPLFFFTHYSTYESAPPGRLQNVPNQLLQARKAVELAAKSGLLAAGRLDGTGLREEEYTREALAQARTFLARAERAYQRDPRGEEVIQFARTAAQSAENARALATGAVGGLLVRQREKELADLQSELTSLKANAPSASADHSPSRNGSVAAFVASLARQPALWFAVAGWALAIVLLFRRRTI